MPTSTLTAKGQTTVPQAVREHLRLQPGDRLDFVLAKDGSVVLRAVTRSVLDLEGALARPGRKKLALAEMDAAIAKAVSSR